jgi:PAS domain S-box-containing protein
MISLTQLFAIGLTYLAILFGSAYATEKGLIPAVIARHPAVRVLSLGVFAGAIAFYGAVGVAAQYGSSFLLYFIGASSAFFIAPVLLGPITKIALAHKLGSLADVFAFRYPASWVGGIISILMLVGVLPLLALQIHAVSVTIHLLNQELSEDVLAILFCITISVFAIAFGARHLSTRDKHDGLVVAIGLESVIKLTAMIVLAIYCISNVFGGTDGLNIWLSENKNMLAAAEQQLGAGASRALLVTFFAATVAMPHVYHMLITENNDERALAGARWGFPLYMFIFSLCIPPILWAATKMGAETPTEFYPIAIGLTTQNQAIAILAFVAGLAAASGVLIVTTLALSSMTLNHILLPLYRPKQGVDIYSVLLNTRRILIAAIILASFGIYKLLGDDQSLMSLGIVAFVAVMQFLPGLVGGFHWHQANKAGLLAGLATGFVVWFASLLLPLIYRMLSGALYTLEINDKSWHDAATLSLIANTAMFIIFSLLTKPTREESLAAAACISDSDANSFRGELEARSVAEMEDNLAMVVGSSVSNREVNIALTELSFLHDENRPYALSQLRKKVETNLSSMMGQTIAHRIIARVFPFRSEAGSVHAMEGYLEDYRSQLTGLAVELDELRRYHRQILQDLPMAVCSIDRNDIIRTWNHAMQDVSGIEPDLVVGSNIISIREPWKDLLNTFRFDIATHRLKVGLNIQEKKLLLNLHKASIHNYPKDPGDLVIVIEDLTESQRIEDQLIHSERLASIGQLAAGIAHEIGNPVTGIAFLTQNLKLDFDQPELQEIANQVLDQTERISTILQSLVNFAYSSKGDDERPSVPVKLQDCINEAIKLLSLNRKEHEFRFTNQCDATAYTSGNPQRLLQVFVNLLSNAQDASGDNDEVQITSRFEGESVIVEIIDQGHGIPHAQLERIFDPFFTTKNPGEGTGLGLAIVSTIIEEHYGSISAASSNHSPGTTMTVRLPFFEHGDSSNSMEQPELTSS